MEILVVWPFGVVRTAAIIRRDKTWLPFYCSLILWGIVVTPEWVISIAWARVYTLSLWVVTESSHTWVHWRTNYTLYCIIVVLRQFSTVYFLEIFIDFSTIELLRSAKGVIWSLTVGPLTRRLRAWAHIAQMWLMISLLDCASCMWNLREVSHIVCLSTVSRICLNLSNRTTIVTVSWLKSSSIGNPVPTIGPIPHRVGTLRIPVFVALSHELRGILTLSRHSMQVWPAGNHATIHCRRAVLRIIWWLFWFLCRRSHEVRKSKEWKLKDLGSWRSLLSWDFEHLFNRLFSILSYTLKVFLQNFFWIGVEF